jgi:hypothetical protein
VHPAAVSISSIGGEDMMRITKRLTTTAIGMALAASAAAHHNSPFGEDGIDIGDMQGMHDATYDRVSSFDYGNTDMGQAMDPADGQMPDGIDPQPSGVNIPDDVLVPGSGPVSGRGVD